MSLVPVDLAVCPDCGAPTFEFGVSQPALFFHGGYGATEHVVQRRCVCGWRTVVSVWSLNPRRLA